MNISQTILQATEQLTSSKSPRLDAEVLLSFVLAKPKEFLYTHPECDLTQTQEKKYFEIISKRATGYPVAYITGQKEFFGRMFAVNESVLIPRPETELVIENLQKVIPNEEHTIIDIGTGSGCIAITCALEFPHCQVLATDISEAALKIAQKNADQLSASVEFLHGDLWKPIEEHFQNKTLPKKSIFIANLPYLTPDQLTGDIVHEPELALVGGKDGLGYYTKLLQAIAISQLIPDYLFLEIDPSQRAAIAHISKLQLKEYTQTHLQDLTNSSRYAFLYK